MWSIFIRLDQVDERRVQLNLIGNIFKSNIKTCSSWDDEGGGGGGLGLAIWGISIALTGGWYLGALGIRVDLTFGDGIRDGDKIRDVGEMLELYRGEILD